MKERGKKKKKKVEEDRVLSWLHLKMAADGSSHVQPSFKIFEFLLSRDQGEKKIYAASLLTYDFPRWKAWRPNGKITDLQFRVGVVEKYDLMHDDSSRLLIFLVSRRRVNSRVNPSSSSSSSTSPFSTSTFTCDAHAARGRSR